MDRKNDDNDVREALADYAHRTWSGWMRYLYDKRRLNVDGTGDVIIPYSLAMRWQCQMNTDYVDLPEDEKKSDRAEADKILAIVQRGA